MDKIKQPREKDHRVLQLQRELEEKIHPRPPQPKERRRIARTGGLRGDTRERVSNAKLQEEVREKEDTITRLEWEVREKEDTIARLSAARAKLLEDVGIDKWEVAEYAVPSKDGLLFDVQVPQKGKPEPKSFKVSTLA